MPTLCSISGRRLDGPATREWIHVGTSRTSSGGRVYLPHLVAPTITDALPGVRIGDEIRGGPDSGAWTFDVRRRDASGTDRMSALDDYTFRGGEVWLTWVGAGDEQAVIGTVTISGTTVTGTGSKFLRQLPPGSKLVAGGAVRTVDAVTSDLAATLTETHPGCSDVEARVTPVYSHAHPLVLAYGHLDQEPEVTPDAATFHVKPLVPPLGKPFLETYAGWGDAVAFTMKVGGGALQADGAGSAVDPGGDFTAECRVWVPLEDATTGGMYLMDNEDVRIRYDGGSSRFEGLITTSSATYEVDSAAVEPERWYLVTMRYDESETRLELLVDAVSADTETTAGTLNTSATAWRFGAQHDLTGSDTVAIVQEWRLWSTYRTDDEVAEGAAGPITGQETGLLFYYSGTILAGDLLESAGANTDAPLDATMSGDYIQTTALEGEAGSAIPRGYGFIEHAPAALVDATNLIYRVDQHSIQQVSAIYEAGVAKTVGNIQNTFKALLTATVAAGAFDICPQLGVVRLQAKSTAGEISADFYGEAQALPVGRSLYFDGSISAASFGTGANDLFKADFTIMFLVNVTDGSVDHQLLASNAEFDQLTDRGFFLEYRNTNRGPMVEAGVSTDPSVALGLLQSIPSPLFSQDPGAFPVHENQTHAVALVGKDLGNSSAAALLYVDGNLADTKTDADAPGTPTASSTALRVGTAGATGTLASDLNGCVGDLAIYNRALTQDEIRAWMWADKTGTSGLAHYYPAFPDAVAGDFYPTTTLVDEVGAVDGTLTAVDHYGALTPTSPAAQAEVILRRDGQLDAPAMDLSRTYEWPTHGSHVYLGRTEETPGGPSRPPQAPVSLALDQALASVNGWRRGGIAPSPLTGTIGITAGTAAATVTAGDVIEEVATPALLAVNGEAIPILSTDSATALTLAYDHTAGASADSGIVWQGQTVLGWIEDPAAATLDRVVPPAHVRTLPARQWRLLPGRIEVARRWIHLVGETNLATTVTEAARALWAQSARNGAVFHWRNWRAANLAGVEPRTLRVLDARWVNSRGGRAEAIRERDLYGAARWELDGAILEDPEGLLEPGAYFSVDNPDVGGVNEFVVLSVGRVQGFADVRSGGLRSGYSIAIVTAWGGTVES